MKIKNQIQPEFLEACVTGADSEELIKLAKKKGIVLPSDHLGAFKTVYARIGDANRNGVRLSREAVEKALPSLIGSQININHWRTNWTVGSIFWAKVNNNDEIEVGFSFFKDVYKKEFEIASALFEDGDLTVSFELNANPDAIEYHDDGTRTLNDITFVGCGLLLDENPAEPTAIVFEMAKKRVMELIRNDSEDLVYAKEAVISCQDLLESINKALEEKSKESFDCQCLDCDKVIKSSKHCKDIKCPSCGGKMRRKDRPGPGNKATEEKSNTTLNLPKGANKNKEELNNSNIDEDIKEGGIQMDKVEDKKLAKIQAELEADEKAEVKTDVKAEVKTDVEVEAEEKSEVKAEEKAELEVVTKVDRTITETMDDNSDTVEVESEVTRTVKRDGEKISEEVTETKEKSTYTFAEVEAIKAEYEATIETLKASIESKDADIEVAKEKAVKVEKLKAELGEYVEVFSEEDFDNEDKVENARLKKENSELKASKDVKKEVVVASEVKEEKKVETAKKVTGHEENPVSKGSALVSILKKKK